MPQLLAADAILYRAFCVELDAVLADRTLSAIAQTLSRVSEEDTYNPFYRWRDGRVPWITTVERKLAPCCPRVARWLSGPLRRTLDPHTSVEQLVAIRCAVLAACGIPSADAEAWRHKGLRVGAGYFARYLAADLLSALILEVGTLRAANDFAQPGTFQQYGVVRGLLRQLARQEPAFAAIEHACTQHVVASFFVARAAAEYYVRRAGVSTGYDPSKPWCQCISQDELNSLYDVDRVPMVRLLANLKPQWQPGNEFEIPLPAQGVADSSGKGVESRGIPAQPT